MEFLIVSGLSGAGKSRAADVLEDLDFYCVDNMPAALLDKFAEFCMGMSGRYERVALVTDIRDREGVDGVLPAIRKLKELGCDCRVLFIEADMATIVKRYKETRRPHPLQDEAGSLETAVRLEMERMGPLREAADYIINTANLTLGMLQAKIYKLFVDEGDKRGISVNVMSFGFKYGLPIEADMVLDVRFLPNPYYIPELRKKTGLDEEVYNFVFEHDTTKEFMAKLKDMVSFLLPHYIEEGKHSLTIAVGCTGGRHRSVAVARALTEYIKQLGQSAELVNRDYGR